MHVSSCSTGGKVLLAILAVSASGNISAQQQDVTDSIIVQGTPAPAAPVMSQGPEIKGIISARNDDKMKIMAADGTSTIIAINDATRIKTGGGLFGSRNTLATDSLLNGLPVTVKTLQSGDSLVASQINLRNKDLKIATMIRNGTAQGFSEQTAATEALRGRMGDIDQYNIKGTTNVNFATGKAVLSAQGKAELCAAVSAAEAMKNAQILVVGYTDSTGSDEFNQQLSEKRASRVVNHIQQACGWKPYRMLTPTGMSEADPLASNNTTEGKAQNRRVSVNILVSKGLDGL
jgi:OmpA-OmpF porin, OOP family